MKKETLLRLQPNGKSSKCNKARCKTSAHIAEKSIDFLDVNIFKAPQFNLKGILDTKVYIKPTDTHKLLHKSSYHPKHTFKGIVQSQIIRFYKSNNTSDFDNACSILFRTLKHRGLCPKVPKNNEKRNIIKTSTKWQIFQM